MRIYVASSWRNNRQPAVVAALRLLGHDVYDFRNPAPNEHGFAWSEIDPEWQRWDAERFCRALAHPIARLGFSRDMRALYDCDACVMVQPCGRSAALELGWACGAGKFTAVFLADGCEPELMLNMAAVVCVSLDELVSRFPKDAP